MPSTWLQYNNHGSNPRFYFFNKRASDSQNWQQLFKSPNSLKLCSVTTSLKCCLPSTHAIDRRGKKSHMRMKVQGRLMQARFIDIHQVFAKKKAGYFKGIPSRCSLPYGRWHYCRSGGAGNKINILAWPSDSFG